MSQQIIDNSTQLDDEQISDQEKIKIVKEFLRYSPPGEFDMVFGNVCVILNQKLEDLPEIKSCALEYHQDQLTTLFLDPNKQEQYLYFLKLRNSGNKAALAAMGDMASDFYEDNGDVMVCPQGHVRDNTFLHAKQNLFFDFDPVTQNLSNIQPAPSSFRPIKAESLRLEIESEIEKYASKHYPKGVTSVFTRLDSDVPEDKEFIIMIEDHEFQPQNKWNGKWRSEWRVSIEDNKVLLQGGVKIHVHYYEDSNVQLVTKQLVDPIEISGIAGDAENQKIAAAVAKIILKLENKYQQNIQKHYNTMNETTFRSLRRQLPVTKTKFNWENVDHFKIARSIHSQDK